MDDVLIMKHSIVGGVVCKQTIMLCTKIHKATLMNFFFLLKNEKMRLLKEFFMQTESRKSLRSAQKSS